MGENKHELPQSERLMYQLVRLEDAVALHKFRHEKTYRRWMGFTGPPPTLEDIIKVIKQDMERDWSKFNILKDSFGRGVYLKRTGEYIGNVHLCKFHGTEELDHVEVGFDIGEAYQNKGYATEAAKTAIEWAFARLRELDSELIIQSHVEHGNIASRRVLEKAGAKFVRDEKYVGILEIRG